jgi:hypothetical protein
MSSSSPLAASSSVHAPALPPAGSARGPVAPSGPPDPRAVPTGTPAPLIGKKGPLPTTGSLYRTRTGENEAALALAQAGYQTVHNPPALTPGQAHVHQLTAGRTPDLMVENKPFDIFTPGQARPEQVLAGIGNTVSGKMAKGQAHGLVINLRDAGISPADVRGQLTSRPYPGLDQAFAVHHGQVTQVYP